MTEALTTEQRKNAEWQLFSARRSLALFVELYESGQWKRLYKEEVFADAVRKAREAVDCWTDVLAGRRK